jgi:localization factor PodJL
VPAAESSPDAAAEPQGNLIDRLKKTLEGHKRPLLFGMAALLLAGGTAQLVLNASNPDAGLQPPQTALAAQAPTWAAPPEESSPLFQPAGLAAIPAQTAPKFWLDPASLRELPQGLPEALRQAALRGDASAVYEIASRAADGRDLDKDPALAARLMERAAQAGLAPAQERLAMFYEKGFGLARDAKLALTWYERAATGGNTRAMHNLATLLAAGIGGKPDYAAALRWYLEAAETGVRDSQFNIGVLFARAVGTRPDLTQSYKWFALAAAQGDPEAAKKRDEVAARLNPSDLAAMRATVERWRPRAVDISANEVAPPAESAAFRAAAGNQI